MPRDSRLSNPSDYIDEVGQSFLKQKKVDYSDSFQAKSSDGEPPFNINRFGARELSNKLVTRKLALNPRLNFVGNQPEEYEVFAGLGRFDTERPELFDFDLGRAKTKMNFTSAPDFKGEWVDAYRLSPTIKPDDKISNPIPRLRNPDPKGYLMAAAENRVESEAEGKVSVASLLSGESGFDKKKEEEEERPENT
jgi:hypothetical protein